VGELEEIIRVTVGIRIQNQIRRLVGRRMQAVRARRMEMRRLKGGVLVWNFGKVEEKRTF
jgi:hypothetical protein